MGGFTFYTGIVIGVANHVLGDERDVGFVTQQVTNLLNYIGIAALLILGWSAWIERRGFPRLLMLLSWLAMALSEITLFLVHAALDRRLETATASAQWGFALIYLWLAIWVWHKTDCVSSDQPIPEQMHFRNKPVQRQ